LDHSDFTPDQPQPEQPLSPPDSRVIYFDVPPQSDRAVVDLKDVVLVLLVAFLSIVLCSSIGFGIAAGATHGHIDVQSLSRNALFTVPAQFVAYVLTVAFMAWLVHRHASPFARGILWNLPEKQLALTALAGGGVMALLSEISSGLLQRWTPKNLPIEEYFKNAASGYALALFGVFIAPVVEELFFRGFLYPALERWIGVVGGLVVTSAAFSLLHGGQLGEAWAPMLVLFLVSSVLTAVRIRTRSVATCVLVHMGYNATLFSIMFIYTQGFRHMEKLH
jgi:membrane protease YdiL (CAAX protease family)